MFNLLAQANPGNFWSAPNGSTTLWIYITAALALGLGLVLVLLALPVGWRRTVVATTTFLAGSYYVLFFFWPKPVGETEGKLPNNAVESVGFWLSDAMPVVSSFTNTLAGFLLGLGIYSLLRVHGRRIFKQQKDWTFSAVLVLAAAAMVTTGFLDWAARKANAAELDNKDNWTFVNYARDFLFDGQFQGMESAMFSIIAFFILSAAYRAFRVRSIEATVLLGSALIVILSLMSLADLVWQKGLTSISSDPNSFVQNFSLLSLSGWLQQNVQTPSIRGIDFGVGVGTVAMGLRLWLSLEKSGASS